MYIYAVGLLLLSKFTALQIFQDALLQRQSFVDGGNDGDDRNQGILEDKKEEKWRDGETSTKTYLDKKLKSVLFWYLAWRRNVGHFINNVKWQRRDYLV